MCQVCLNIYCITCSGLIESSNRVCPMCKSYFTPGRVTHVFKNLLEKLVLSGCSDSHCDRFGQPMAYQELVKHSKTDCKGLTGACLFTCGNLFTKSETAKHYLYDCAATRDLAVGPSPDHQVQVLREIVWYLKVKELYDFRYR